MPCDDPINYELKLETRSDILELCILNHFFETKQVKIIAMHVDMKSWKMDKHGQTWTNMDNLYIYVITLYTFIKYDELTLKHIYLHFNSKIDAYKQYIYI